MKAFQTYELPYFPTALFLHQIISIHNSIHREVRFITRAKSYSKYQALSSGNELLYHRLTFYHEKPRLFRSGCLIQSYIIAIFIRYYFRLYTIQGTIVLSLTLQSWPNKIWTQKDPGGLSSLPFFVTFKRILILGAQ